VPERHDQIRRWLVKLEAGQPVASTAEVALLAKGGRRVPVEISVRPLVEGKRVVGVEGVARDITERKRAEAELAAANQRLVETSRRAGMAEVAAGVLHNVGNVLTSVNVSAAEVAEKVKGSKLPGLGRAVSLLREHEGDLARFLSEDPRGRELPGYLSALADQLSAEQVAVAREVESLGRGIEHMKEGVSMQQGYARVSGVREEVTAETLVEDALRINREGLDRHRIAVVREFSAVPPLLIEKHKVLQILVNLLSNAKYACHRDGAGAAGSSRGGGSGGAGPAGRSGGAGAAGRITLRVETPKGERDGALVRIVIADNGVGIPHENLTRIFEHGFTTRQSGHGFGLHSAALTARELGGTLSVHSDGPGKGSRFTLELPVRPSPAGARAGNGGNGGNSGNGGDDRNGGNGGAARGGGSGRGGTET
jgi:signal transduction histidine kinase